MSFQTEKQTSLDNSDSLLQNLLNDLRERPDDEAKIHAAKCLQNYVSSRSRDMSSEVFKKWMKQLLKEFVWDLINSPMITEKVGGLIAVDALIDVAYEEFTSMLANYYRHTLKTNEAHVLVWAARAIGHMSRINSTITAECVEFDMQRALEWLQGERQEVKRHAACLILKELAENSPSLFYAYITQFVELIWVALRDPKYSVRESAVAALEGSLSVISERESRFRQQWYQRMFEEAQRGFGKQATTESIHASILTVSAMLEKSGDFLKERFNGIGQTVLLYKEHRDKIVKRSVIEVLPRLARFSPEKFIFNYFEQTMNYLLNLIRKDVDCRAAAYMSLGQIALIVQSQMVPYIDSIFASIKVGLVPKAKSVLTCPEAIICCSMVARSLGMIVTEHIAEILDAMFAGGLNPILTKSLKDIAFSIPALAGQSHEKLLDLISLTLSGKPFDFPGTPAKFRKQEPVLAAAVTPNPKDEDEAVVLALTILADFEFSPLLLVDLLRNSVISYLMHPNLFVHRQAAVCCTKLLCRIAKCTSSPSMAVNEILEKLLLVGVTDFDAVTRVTIMSLLEESLDTYLAQCSNLKHLLVALNDETFEIREKSLGLVCRLGKSNPAYVMPALRKILIDLLMQLDRSGDNLTKEESSKLLGQLISTSPYLVKPYIGPLMDALLPKLRDPDSGVSSSVLSTVGELACVTGTDMMKHINDLLPIVIETLQDLSSPAKREVAIRTLGRLTQSTGYVVEPFIKYPKLLDIILHEILTETNSNIRQEVIRVLGIIGAVDPYKHKQNQLVLGGRKHHEEGTGKTIKAVKDPDISHSNLSPASEDYYPTITISALVRILKDPSLTQHHTLVVHTLMLIVKSLGAKSIQFLPHIMPQFLTVMKNCEPDFRSTLFQQLGVMVSRVKQHIRVYLPDFMNLIKEYWKTSSTMNIIGLIEELSQALSDEFKTHLVQLMPLILQLLHVEPDSKPEVTSKALHALVTLGSNLTPYLHLVVPAVVKVCEHHSIKQKVRNDALVALDHLCATYDVSMYTSLILHCMTRALDTPFPDTQTKAMLVLTRIMKKLGRDFLVYKRNIDRILLKHGIGFAAYDELIHKMLHNIPLEDNANEAEANVRTSQEPEEEIIFESSTSVKRIKVNEQNLRRAWEISEGSTKEDWTEWLKQFSVALLRESPSPALRSCISLANDYYPLVKELFNAAFVSCWSELSDRCQDELVRNLETALMSNNIPADILQTLLNLAEFMDQRESSLPIDCKTLGLLAEKCHAYAKALHYKEIEFQSSPVQSIEGLISLNNKLQQPEAALGILTYAQKQHNVQLKESWYEKLQRWDLAIQAYEKNTTQEAESLSFTLGRMRCLNALGEWEKLAQLSQSLWQTSNTAIKTKIAPVAAASAWNLSQWELFRQYVDVMPRNSVDGCFYRAVLNIHNDNFEQAQSFIDMTRKLVDNDLTALVGESYSRAYSMMVKVQQLAELEEIIQFKKSPIDRNHIIATWNERLRGCEQSVDTWQSILLVRSLVLKPVENIDTLLKFATLCRKSRRSDLSHKTIVGLLGKDPLASNTSVPLTYPRVTYAYIKQLWNSAKYNEAYDQLRKFPAVKFDLHLQARIFLKLGEWQSILEGLNSATLPQVIQAYHGAIECDKNWYKAWNYWALANYSAVNYFMDKSGVMSPVMSHPQAPQAAPNQRLIIQHLVSAISGFFRSISISQNLQDTLRILTILFNHGNVKEVEHALTEGFQSISIDTWMQVIPQLIARIHSPVAPVRKMIHDLLNNIGKVHPQALVYPLIVATKSQSAPRVAEARSILTKMATHSAKLVEQTEFVSNELVRVSVLWIEMWHEALEEASRAFFEENDVNGMLNILKPLHAMMEKGGETYNETMFLSTYAAEFKEAYEWCKRWERSRKSNDLNQAWQFYTQAFKKIDKALPTTKVLELPQISPKLLTARDLDLCVPGTYRAGQPVVQIRSFNPVLNVIKSKQRPRQITIHGSDGADYMFLLKGHEDLRQDERVMQLFGLVNALLNADHETSKNHLQIQKYSVVPLSPNCGLIGWVTHGNTLHELIEEYRDTHKIWLNIEHRLMNQFAPDFTHLTLIQKVEAFKYALDNTSGTDLQRILWLKSSNSEVWLDRRTNYTRSLAVMSMVGYILGLGDRHPGNLMLDRHTGNVVHIDFGDCFEVTMHRAKYPEKIPFRLTRMLVNAMEVSGIEGTFRFSCEDTMRVLRENKDSLMSVLEAFVYDPIINWRLLTPGAVQESQPNDNNNANTAEVLNKRAYQVISRVNQKLTGKDFGNETPLDISDQVQRLIDRATSHENLCQCFVGWCAFW